MVPQWNRMTKILCATYALALLVGVGVGYRWGETKRTWLRPVLEAIRDLPLAGAADLAFRHGTVAHAKILNTGRRDSDDFSVFYRELKLAFLDGEHIAGSGHDTHLVRAAAACKRIPRQRCTVEQLRRSAGHFAKWRPQ